MARFKLTMALGEQKQDIAEAAYTTGDATADIEINVDSAVFTDSGQLFLALELMQQKILDEDFPPA